MVTNMEPTINRKEKRSRLPIHGFLVHSPDMDTCDSPYLCHFFNSETLFIHPQLYCIVFFLGHITWDMKLQIQRFNTQKENTNEQ